MTDDAATPLPANREPLYFRLTSGLPAMVWPSPDGSEAIVQIGRARPSVVPRYSREDAASLNVVLLDLLAKTEALVPASEWHRSMADGQWEDGTPSREIE